MKKRITLAQIGRYQDPSRHIRHIKDIIQKHKDSDLIVFPELILHGHPSLERPEGLLYREMKLFYKNLAKQSDDLYHFIKKTGARVIFGELRGKPGVFYNVATYIDRKTIFHYNKTHIHWTENFLPGKRLEVIDIPAGKVGLCICFDGAFSEVWRVLALKGAEIVVNISATPKSFNHAYIKRRLQGAAILNQFFVVYVNRPDRIFSGHSMVIDPRGEILTDLGGRTKIQTFTIDLKEVREWRQTEEVYPNRRPQIYMEIVRRTEPSQKEVGKK